MAQGLQNLLLKRLTDHNWHLLFDLSFLRLPNKVVCFIGVLVRGLLMNYPKKNRENETFEKRSILLKIKAQRRDWAKGGVFQGSQNGFSLIELLFALAIFLIILAAITSAFISQRKTYNVQEQVAEMNQGARSAMDMLSTEIRQAGYNPANISGFTGIPYSASQLQLFTDLNCDGDTLDAPNENIIYIYDSTNLRINRNDVNTEDLNHPFAENVQSHTVKYFEGDGVTEVLDAVDNSKIRQIEITIVVRTSDPDPDYSTNSGYRSFTLRSRITPVNLGL